MSDALAERGLPEIAYVDNSEKIYGDAEVITIKRGCPGYYPIRTHVTAKHLNDQSGVTDDQVEAMLAGSMFGWHTEAAFPRVHAAKS